MIVNGCDGKVPSLSSASMSSALNVCNPAAFPVKELDDLLMDVVEDGSGDDLKGGGDRDREVVRFTIRVLSAMDVC